MYYVQKKYTSKYMISKFFCKRYHSKQHKNFPLDSNLQNLFFGVNINVHLVKKGSAAQKTLNSKSPCGLVIFGDGPLVSVGPLDSEHTFQTLEVFPVRLTAIKNSSEAIEET